MRTQKIPSGPGILTACAVLALVLSPSAAQAGPIISPTGATASSTFNATYSIINTINHAGLLTNFVSGVTDFDAYLALTPQHTFLADNNEWFSANGETSATVTYDLGSAIAIDRLALWNEEFSGFGTARVSTSLDNTAYSFLMSINPVDSPSDLNYGAQVFALGALTTRYVRFEVSGCPQPNGNPLPVCGIGEVAFATTGAAATVPEPASATLMVLGLGALGMVLRRRSQSRA